MMRSCKCSPHPSKMHYIHNIFNLRNTEFGMHNIVLLKKADCLKDTLNIMILLRDDFRIDLAINPMVAVLA